MITKTCTKCKIDKPLDAFSKHSKGKHGRNTACKECKNQQARAFYAENSEEILSRQRNRENEYAYQIKKRYGITIEEYDAMLERQSGVCAICKKHRGKRLSVDHCHTTGKVRGLLCNQCNLALGKFEDNIDALKAAVEYLGAFA